MMGLEREMAGRFRTRGDVLSVEAYGNGHIHKTYLLTTTTGRYILQKINDAVFGDVDGLMSNISKVTGYLRGKVAEDGGDPARETLSVVPTDGGALYAKDGSGGHWRMYDYIPDSHSKDAAEGAETLRKTGKAFGRFMRSLDGFPAHELNETIRHFHDTRRRYEALLAAVEDDRAGRAAASRPEIEFFTDRADEYGTLVRLLGEGRLPLRVTHNDTKLNNILFDDRTGESICVIDLDTVMPGLSLYDYGDAIRFAASTAAEDERDLSLVTLSLPYFGAYTEGFLSETGSVITDEERRLLPTGAKVITMECGMRFLTDHLNGDVYFSIKREGHNLDRARTQARLAADMERKWGDMHAMACG
ncbi:MAG: aminoglycoside phosphotransferase family protein [Oscillospiraceae bacterium]|nr:aminoglycoside phosphotransferase family protein [Oscillospiraceae bacterium]